MPHNLFVLHMCSHTLTEQVRRKSPVTSEHADAYVVVIGIAGGCELGKLV